MNILEQQAEKRVLEYLNKRELEFYKNYISDIKDIDHLTEKIQKLLHKRIMPINNFVYYLLSSLNKVKENDCLYLTQPQAKKDVIDFCFNKIENINLLLNQIVNEIFEVDEILLIK